MMLGKPILKKERKKKPSICNCNQETWTEACVCLLFSLVYGLQELPLVLAYARVVNLLHQLGVFVDQPRFSENVGRCVLYLQGHNAITTPLATVWHPRSRSHERR